MTWTLQPTAVPDPTTTRPLDQSPNRDLLRRPDHAGISTVASGNFNLTPDKIDFFILILYILMNTVPSQIQATTNLGPSAPCPDWPLPVSLTITAFLILVLAIGLVTVSPQDWSLILRLSVGIAYVVSCVLLLGYYFLCTA